MKIDVIWEHNGPDTLLHCGTLPGAYARGKDREEALSEMAGEVRRYLRWMGRPQPQGVEVSFVQEKVSNLDIWDADSDVLFDSECQGLTMEEYLALKALALQSAADFQALYDSIPEKDKSCLPFRKTFYGPVPRTAEEMYQHTKSVNSYYFGELDVAADNIGTIAQCRQRGFAALEAVPDFLYKPPVKGSYAEAWSLRKLLRRFLWHDRIHARAMYRMARKTFPEAALRDSFYFEETKEREP